MLCVDRRADGDDLCARRPITPIVQFRYLCATSDNLQGDPFSRLVRDKDDAFAPVNGRWQFLPYHFPKNFQGEWPIGLIAPGVEHVCSRGVSVVVLVFLASGVISITEQILRVKTAHAQQDLQRLLAARGLDARALAESLQRIGAAAGKKVVVVMAGNPYTESGERFQIPDMLSNRADVYNLGEIIGDSAEVFELSYLENCLTSNPVLNKLATTDVNNLTPIEAINLLSQIKSEIDPSRRE